MEHLPSRNDPRVHVHSALENMGLEVEQPHSRWALMVILAGRSRARTRACALSRARALMLGVREV